MRFQIVSILALVLATTTFAAPIHSGTGFQGISHHDDSAVERLYQYHYAHEHKGVSRRDYEEELDIRDLGEDMEMDMMKREPMPGCIGDACKHAAQAAGKAIKAASQKAGNGVKKAALDISKKTH